MTFKLLQNYKHLAWDFDDTLICHRLSEEMWQFIIDNPFDQQHSIITMRSHGMETAMFQLLEAWGSDLIRANFEHVLNVSDALYESYKRDPYEEHAYTEWKGRMCKEIGADVLIDDMEEVSVSKRGCVLHNIPHIHPDDLI